MAVGIDELKGEAFQLKIQADSGGWTAATAESCTGGLLGALITAVPGSSSWYLGGVVSYANGVKNRLLGVEWSLLETEGAVSRACALAMVQGVERLTGAHLCLSVTGIAGPDGGLPDKPVGTVWFGLSFRERGQWAFRKQFEGSREDVRLQSAAFGFDLLRRAMARDASLDHESL